MDAANSIPPMSERFEEVGRRYLPFNIASGL
jgi:hypothetical protein